MGAASQATWLDQSVGIRRLDDRTIIEVSGDDAREWLQGQLTNQIEGVSPGDSVYGFILTLKGRILADAWLLARPENFWLDVPTSQVDALIERLDRYIIMEDVDLTVRDDLALLAAVGPKTHDIEGGWPADRLGTGGKVWVAPLSEVDAEYGRRLTEANSLGGGAIEDDGWVLGHVRNGRPRFGADFGEDTYPQETGLTERAVSFNKGCYIGQETVVMLQNRGKAPKVLWRWRVDTPDTPARSTPITRNDVAVGTLTSAAADGDTSYALGFVKRGHQEIEGSWQVGDSPATPLGPVGESQG